MPRRGFREMGRVTSIVLSVRRNRVQELDCPFVQPRRLCYRDSTLEQAHEKTLEIQPT